MAYRSECLQKRNRYGRFMGMITICERIIQQHWWKTDDTGVATTLRYTDAVRGLGVARCA